MTHDELEISGYKDALKLIHTEYNDLDIEEDVICIGYNGNCIEEFKIEKRTIQQ